MTEDLYRIQDEGTHLVVWNANLAQRNALSGSYATGLRKALDLAAETPRIGAVILAGAEEFFCSGGNISLLMRAQASTPEEREHHLREHQSLTSSILDCPRPVIAAVEGGALGAGLSLALACDLIVCAENARLAATYVSLGLVPDGGLTGSALAALPPALAAELLLLGAEIEPMRLQHVGAINRIAPPGKALEQATTIAVALAHGPALAQSDIKSLLTKARREIMDKQLEAEIQPMSRALVSEEARRGITAVMSKSRPEYRDLRAAG